MRLTAHHEAALAASSVRARQLDYLAAAGGAASGPARRRVRVRLAQGAKAIQPPLRIFH